GTSGRGAVHRQPTADRGVDEEALVTGETRDEHHVGLVGLGQAHGLAARLVEIDEMGRGLLDERVSRQVSVCDAEGPWREYPTLHPRIAPQVTESFQGVSTALRGAFGHSHGSGNFGEVHGPPFTPEHLENG